MIHLNRAFKGVAFVARLTVKQKKFADLVLGGMTQAEAYRTAFNVNPNGSAKTHAVNAHEIASKPHVRDYLNGVKAAATAKVQITIETLLEELEEARDAALTSEIAQSSAAVAASMAKAKLLGLDKTQIELTGKNGGPIEVRSQLISKIASALAKLKDE